MNVIRTLTLGSGVVGAPTRLPDRRLQMYIGAPFQRAELSKSIRQFQTLHRTDSSLQSFLEIYSVSGDFKFHLAEHRVGPG